MYTYEVSIHASFAEFVYSHCMVLKVSTVRKRVEAGIFLLGVVSRNA